MNDNAEFSIISIEHGWLNARIEVEGACVALANSCIDGLGLPCRFINALIGILNGQEESCVFWNEESCGQVVKIGYADGYMKLQVFQINRAVMKTLQNEEAAKLCAGLEPTFEAQTDMYAFASSVYEAFGFYVYGEGEKAWRESQWADCYLKEELRTLKKALHSNR